MFFSLRNHQRIERISPLLLSFLIGKKHEIFFEIQQKLISELQSDGNFSFSSSSIDRAMSVLFPIGSRQFCRRQIAYTITFILVFILTILNSRFLYGFVIISANSTLNTKIEYCYHRDDSMTYQKLFAAYDSYVDVIKTNVIPFIIMSICNLIIILRVCRSNSSIYLTSGRNANRTTKSKRKYEKDRQLTFMLLGSAIAFLVLTLPTEINDIIRSHSGEKLVNEKKYLLSAILLSLAHLNYAVRISNINFFIQ